MPRPKRTLPPSDDPQSFGPLIASYMASLRRRSFSEATVRRMERSLIDFGLFCDARSLTRPSMVTRPAIERYARFLYEYRRSSGEPLVVASQRNMLQVVKQFFGFLVRENRVLYNPASELEMPRRGRRLPRAVLTHEEVERVFAQPDLRTLVGVRDRAILETMYSTGIRRFELVRLEVHDLDMSQGTLFIREGKGKKDRVVPIGERARDWNEKYLTRVRPSWVRSSEQLRLYITERGDELTVGGLGNGVRDYLQSAEIEKEGGCHLFRHAMATQMLERGADIRAIQEMLGHASLETTQVYTQVSITHLQSVHARTHPTAKRAADEGPAKLARRGSPRSLARAGFKTDAGSEAPNEATPDAREGPPEAAKPDPTT